MRSVSYTETINSVFPNAKIIKCQGYMNGNTQYSSAKKPLVSYLKKESLTEAEINAHLTIGGWIGVLVPKGYIVIDLDDLGQASYLIQLLNGEKVKHYLIKTSRGYQFVFKATTTANVNVKMISRFYTSIGIVIDTRVGTTNSFIVFPTDNTENRFLVEVKDELDELPDYLRPVWNASKTKDYYFPVPMEVGSRNQSLYDLGRRLKSIGLSMDQIKTSMLLVYKYFCVNKDNYTLGEVMSSIKSIENLEPTIRKKVLREILMNRILS